MKNTFSALFFILFACQSATLFANSKPASSAKPVITIAVEAKALLAELTITGDVVSQQHVDIGSEIAGTVVEVLVEVGDNVTTNQPLFTLRNTATKWRLVEAKASLASAKSSLRLQQLEQQRLRKLLTQHSISQGQFDQSEAKAQQAKANVEAQTAVVAQWQDQLDRHQISAPFDGIITHRFAEKGGWLKQGSPVVTLVSMDNLRLELAVPQSYYPYLSTQTSVHVSSDLRRQTTAASVERIIAAADQSRNFHVWVSLNNSSGLWLPGMSANGHLSWQGNDLYPWLLPTDALIRHADGSIIVWKLQAAEGGSRVTPISVQAGQQAGGQISVASKELQAGDVVVIKGNEMLQANQLVKPVQITGNR